MRYYILHSDSTNKLSRFKYSKKDYVEVDSEEEAKDLACKKYKDFPWVFVKETPWSRKDFE